MVGTQAMMMATQTRLQPGDLVFTHPQDNPEHIKKLPSYTHVLAYLVLSEELAPKSQPWYRIMCTSKITGETKIYKLPANMLTRFEELND